MWVVMDTNVMVSALLSPGGLPAQVVSRCFLHEYHLLVAPPLLAEYYEIVRRPHIVLRHGMTADEIAQWEAGLSESMVHVTLPDLIPTVCADPDDDMFLACAIAGEADVIVSGDTHLLTLGRHAGIPILTPAAFLARLDEIRSTQG